MAPSRRIEDCLARFAGNCPDAALRHDRHKAGVEISPKGWRDAASGGGGGVVGVDVEGAVFLNDPAIVGDSCSVFAIQNRDLKIAWCREVQRHGRGSGTERPLRVLRLVGKAAW